MHDSPPQAGILLINLGTPEAPTPAAVQRYLAEFLSDPRVVELPRFLWLPILHSFILRIRPAQSARKYQAIWTPEGSPLLGISRRQVAALACLLKRRFPGPIQVVLGMRYGRPSIAAALAELQGAGVQRLLVLPLYPQYAAATTGSAFDAVTLELRKWRWVPELRFVTHYYDHPAYLDALAATIDRASVGQPGERMLFSFHGLPKRTLWAGDPYYYQCQETARLVAERLALAPHQWTVAFQSRFGRTEWLQPYTSAVLIEWAKAGVRSVDVVCPGFAADCLETLEEIAVENRQIFLHAGGHSYRYLPALNDASEHIAALATLIKQHTSGWPEFG